MKHQPPQRSLVWSVALAAAVAGAPGLVMTARAEAPTHEIQKDAPPARVGVPAKASVTIQGRNGWHLNQEAPVTVHLKADPGVDLPKPKQGRTDLVQSSSQSARFDIPFSATAAGKTTITAETRFVMCQEQACKPVKEIVALEIDVASSAPPSAPAGNTPRKTKAPKPH